MKLEVSTLQEILKQSQGSNAHSEFHQLETWCRDNLSTDIDFQPSEAGELNRYLEDYLDFLSKFSTTPIDERSQDYGNHTAIQYAAIKGYDQFIQTVLSKNAKDYSAYLANQHTAYQMTPLYLAAKYGQLNTFQVLLAHGANPELPCTGNQLAIHGTVSLPQNLTHGRHTSIFHRLEASQPNRVNQGDISGNTVAHMIAENGPVELMQHLITHYPDLLSCKNNFGRTPLHLAILNAPMNILDCFFSPATLLERLWLIGDANGRTALHYAARYRDSALIEKFLTVNNIALECQDSYHCTPLLLAAEAGKLTSVQQLIAADANRDAIDCRAKGVNDYAKESGNAELITWLEEQTHQTNLNIK